VPTENEFWDVAAQVFSERGGLVVGFSNDAAPPEPGTVLDKVLGFTPPYQATVANSSDWGDWQEQVEAFYRLRPSWGRGKNGDPSALYYRVKFDPALSAKTFPSPAPFAASSTFADRLILPSLSAYAESGLRGVGFWPRVLARVFDFVIHYLSGFIAGSLFVFLLAFASGGRPPIWALQRISHTRLPLFITALFGSMAYQVICASVSGRTLGKLILSMQVVQDDGSPCRLKSAMIRELGYYLDALFFGVIAYVAMKDDPSQRRHGDDWAHTIVCRRADVPPQSRQDGPRFLLGLMLGVLVDIAFLMLGALIQMNL
jgi:uncharacterized RDD family membrane protein YckC